MHRMGQQIGPRVTLKGQPVKLTERPGPAGAAPNQVSLFLWVGWVNVNDENVAYAERTIRHIRQRQPAKAAGEWARTQRESPEL